MSGIDYELSTLGSKIKVRLFTSKGEMVYLDVKENVKIDGKKFDLSEIDAANGAKAALELLATDTTGGKYKVTKAYVLNYIVNDDNVVTEFDLGGIGGPGNLEKQTGDSCTRLLTRTQNVLVYAGKDGSTIRQRLNPNSKIMFGVPKEGDLENLDAYELKSFVINEIYGKELFSKDEYEVDKIDVYTYNENTYPMADVILLTGGQAEVTSATKNDIMDIVVGVSEAVTDDGEKTVKLYMNNAEYYLTPQVIYTEGGVNSEVNAIDLYNGGKFFEGLLVQYALNGNKEIAAIRTVAKYDSETENIIPMFADASKYIEESFDSPTDGTNVFVGIIEGIDLNSRQAYFTEPGSSTRRFLYIPSGDVNVVIYDTNTGDIMTGTKTDIMPEDKFVASIDIFYTPKTFVIFR